jgi:hypothetical protein
MGKRNVEDARLADDVDRGRVNVTAATKWLPGFLLATAYGAKQSMLVTARVSTGQCEHARLCSA